MKLLEVKNLADNLLNEFKLYDWKFKFDTSKVRFGQCNYKNKTISLSKALCELNGFEEINDTIRHEIAHAIISKHNGHNDTWREACLKVGARPKTCYSSKNVIGTVGNYRYKCRNCGKVFIYHRKLRRAKACGKCCRIYNNRKFSFDYQLRYIEATELNNEILNILKG